MGTTIYPGMQITAVAITRGMEMTMTEPMSLNDVCCYIPVWGGVTVSDSEIVLCQFR